MSVLSDIVEAYRRPAPVFRRRLGEVPREDRALAVLMAACLMVFVAQWPRLQRVAFETGEDFEPLVGGALFAWLFVMPLVAYALGTVTHLIARALGGHGSPYAARFALFWALLVASPLWLLSGLVAGFIGQGPQLALVGAVALGAFLVHWSLNLWAAERP
ncbi:MAG: YIP1 family protein [Maritimibacter sp.]|nr:YIP1 family protein [Maritimibacter sp.]